MLNIFYGRRLREFPGLLRDRPSSWDLPITLIQPQSFRNGEWLLNALRQPLITWFIPQRKHRCWLWLSQYYSKHLATEQCQSLPGCNKSEAEPQRISGFRGALCTFAAFSANVSFAFWGRGLHCRHVGYAHWLHHQGEIYTKTLW
jgi:hypothetical protein